MMNKPRHILLLLAAACCASVASAQAVAPPQAPRQAGSDGVQLYGVVFNAFGSSTPFEEHGEGLYTLNTANPASVKLVKQGIRGYGGGTYAQGVFYASNYTEDESGRFLTMPVKLSPYSAETWTADTVYRGFAFSSIASDMTFDPVTQRVYGCFYDEDYNLCQTLGRLRLGPADATWGLLFGSDAIGQLPERMVALTASLAGQLYGIGQSGQFYLIDKYTAAATAVGETGVKPMPLRQSATYDYTSGKIYWAANFLLDGYADAAIYEVDPATGKATMVTDLTWNGTQSGEQFVGLFVKQDLNLFGLPGQVTNLSAEATSLTGGKVSFTLPQNDVSGQPIAQNLSYAIRLNGSEVARGEGAPGDALSVPFSSTGEGEAMLLVTAAVPSAGDSPEAVGEPDTVRLWLGHGVPLSPSSLTLKDEGTEVQISWHAPEGCVNGGYLDAENLTYTVMRYQAGQEPDSTVLVEGLKDVEYYDGTLPETSGTYYYKVVAHNGPFASTAARSADLVRLGSLPLPYSNAMDTQESVKDYTIVDANGDGHTWKFDDYNAMMAYSYNSKASADDWMITPAIRMRRNAVYTFSFEALNSYPVERIEAKVGDAATAEAMTEVVIEPTDIEYQPRVHTLTGKFRAPSDGMRHFGIHAISDADMSTLYIRNLTITESPLTSPDEVSGFSVVPGEKGSPEAAISFVAPTADLSGNPISGTMRVRLTRDGVELTTLDEVKAGQACSYTDQNVPSGSYTYSAVAINDKAEEGVEVSQTVFVGLDTPGAVVDLRAVEDLEHEGRIHVTWRAPEKGAHGGYIDPAGLTYYLSRGYETEDRNLGNQTSFEDQLETDGRQTFSGYTVYAANSTGASRDLRKTCTVIAGPALQAPMVESFAGGTIKSGPWLTNVTIGEIGEAYCYMMSEYEGLAPQDNDGGMQSFSAIGIGKAVRSESPKVDISRLETPVLHFWALFNGASDSLIVSVSPDYEGFVPQMRLSAANAKEGWNRYSLDLAAFKGSRFVQIGFEGKAMSDINNFIDFDNVSIVEDVEYDLMALSIAAPARAEANSEVNVQFALRNNSFEGVASDDYTVTLYKNGEAVATQKGVDVACDGVATITIADAVSVLDADTVVYEVGLEMAKDEIPDNNISSEAVLLLNKPDYPAPLSLTAVRNNDVVNLNWQEPDLLNRPSKAVTDGFDSYTAFDIAGYGQWTTVDADGQNTIMITLNSMFGPLQYNNAGKPMAFQVFNVMEAGIPFASWDPYSGEQMLVCFANASPDGGYSPGKPNDDWLISPELSGQAQTIRLFAKAGMGGSYVPEQMELLYSTTDTRTESFVKVGETIDVDNVDGWAEHSFDVPAGAKYFAIHCVSDYKFALLIDDVTYIPAGAEPEPLTLLGYHVYRDKQRVSESIVQTTAFTDASADAKTYQVTAVYDKGESAPAQVAVDNTGVRDTQMDGCEVLGEQGRITVSGAQGREIGVFTADGRSVAMQRHADRATFAVPSGLYVVLVDGKAYKVSVR